VTDRSERSLPFHVIRFDALRPLRANPADTLLSRYRRERFSVIGRADERAPGEPGTEVAANLNFGFIRCAPGCGNCSHRHPNWEIFIPMSGRWELSLEGGSLGEPGDLLLDAWDVIVIPPNTYHAATNVSDREACLMSLNPGRKGAPYVLHPSVIEELSAFSAQAGEAARRGLDMLAKS
jgi:quercetin dioxygenase-like cupin family protein